MAVQETSTRVSETGDRILIGFKEAGPESFKEMEPEQVSNLIVQLDEAANEAHRRRVTQRLLLISQ